MLIMIHNHFAAMLLMLIMTYHHLADMLLTQSLACVNSQQEVDSIVADLGQAGAMRHTTVIAAPQGCGLGERYAALCSALSVGEKVRDQGGHSFVVLDDISCMVSP